MKDFSLPISTNLLACQIIYSMLLNHEDLPPPTSEDKLLASGVEEKDLAKLLTTKMEQIFFQYQLHNYKVPKSGCGDS